MATGRIPDPNSAPITAKGDLYTYSTVPARLAVGNNGETLVADSSATTGLRWQGNFAAGKNKIINGDFRINQRGFSSTTTSGDYGFDRFKGDWSGGVTYSSQAFTVGSAPVAGYEAVNYARLVTSGQTNTNTYSIFYQAIEDVRTFAGQTMTYSFWAKAATGTPKVYVEFDQQFGSGGSARVLTAGSSVTLSTSWARYSVTINVPSISGKTIGTSSFVSLNMWFSAGSDFNARTGSLGIQSNTFDFWGLQAEAGNVATAFQTATGTLAGELAACQRYYYRIADSSQNYTAITVMHDTSASSATNLNTIVSHPVPMRVAAISTEFSNLALHRSDGTIFAITAVTVDSATDSVYGAMYGLTSSGLTAGNVGRVLTNNNSAGYFGVSAEL